MTLALILLACLAVFLELAHRAPLLDKDGRLIRPPGTPHHFD